MNDVKVDTQSPATDLVSRGKKEDSTSGKSLTRDLKSRLGLGKNADFVTGPSPKKASGRLRGKTFKVSAVSQEQRDELWTLYSKYYLGGTRESFNADFSEKTHVVMVFDSGNDSIQGFTTIKLYDHQVGGKNVLTMYTGDTMIHPDYWGQKAYHITMFKFIIKTRLLNPTRKMFWFLLCNGFRTYLVFARNSPVHWPRFDQQTPTWEKSLIDSLARERFGHNYLPDLGIVKFTDSLGRLKPNVAPIGKEELKHPEIRFLVESNPGYVHGDELCCIAEINPKLFLYFPQKVVKKFFKGLLASELKLNEAKRS